MDRSRLASRQRCSSPRPRRCGVVIGRTGCHPSPRLRESPVCLLPRPDPRQPASAPGSRSRGRAATLDNADLAPGPDEQQHSGQTAPSSQRRRRPEAALAWSSRGAAAARSDDSFSPSAAAGLATGLGTPRSRQMLTPGDPFARSGSHDTLVGIAAESVGFQQRTRRLGRPEIVTACGQKSGGPAGSPAREIGRTWSRNGLGGFSQPLRERQQRWRPRADTGRGSAAQIA